MARKLRAFVLLDVVLALFLCSLAISFLPPLLSRIAKLHKIDNQNKTSRVVDVSSLLSVLRDSTISGSDIIIDVSNGVKLNANLQEAGDKSKYFVLKNIR